MSSLIRWKRGDYVKLGKAVSEFNKKISQLETEENKLYLPEKLNYKDVKNEIKTRQGLNSVINSLRRFQKEDATDLYKTKAGEILSKWERNEISIQSRVATRRLNKELKELNELKYDGFSRVQMGSFREKEIKRQLEKIKNLENTTGRDFLGLKSRILNNSSANFFIKRALAYQKNYINEMKKYSHFDNYNKLIDKLNSIKNPDEFYKFVSKNEITKDLTYQSDNVYTQEAFNSYLEELGIELENDSMSYFKL